MLSALIVDVYVKGRRFHVFNRNTGIGKRIVDDIPDFYFYADFCDPAGACSCVWLDEQVQAIEIPCANDYLGDSGNAADVAAHHHILWAGNVAGA